MNDKVEEERYSQKPNFLILSSGGIKVVFPEYPMKMQMGETIRAIQTLTLRKHELEADLERCLSSDSKAYIKKAVKHVDKLVDCIAGKIRDSGGTSG